VGGSVPRVDGFGRTLMPGLVMSYDPVVGVLCMALSADWCALFLYHAIRRSARNYDALEVGV